MNRPNEYPRYILPRVMESLADSPVVLIHGPRQCGKTTLVKHIGAKERYAYFNFDHDVQREAAMSDPVGYVADLPEKAILDEVQKVPELFTSLKAAVDEKRDAGRFILTGSAHVMMVPALSDSLAGRMEILRLHPFAQVELAGRPAGFLDALFENSFKPKSMGQRMGRALAERMVAGGFPAALLRNKPERQIRWYKNYIDTIIQRDIRDLTHIGRLDAIPRLFTLAAGQTARLLNVSHLAAPFQVSRPTIREYITLLSHIFLLEEVPAWHNNRLKRIVKTPKLHIGDSGLVCALLGLNPQALWNERSFFGQVLETFVYQELRRQAGWHEELITFSHYRDKDKVEVDLVLQSGTKTAGIEIKAGSTVRADDFKGLRKLIKALGHKFAAGVVLYDGGEIIRFGESLYAVPISCIWEYK